MSDKRKLLNLKFYEGPVCDSYISTDLDTEKLFRPLFLTFLYTNSSKYAISNTRISYCRANIQYLFNDYEKEHNIEKNTKEYKEMVNLINTLYYPTGNDLNDLTHCSWNNKSFPKPLKFYNKTDNKDGFFALDYTAEAFQNDVDSTHILSDFLNMDFSNYDDYFIFFTKYFISFIDFLEDEDIKNLKADYLYNFNEINDLAKKYYPIIINLIKEKQADIKELINYSYNYDSNDKNNISSIIEIPYRFSAYRLKHKEKYDYFSNNIIQIGRSYDVTLDNYYDININDLTLSQLQKEISDFHIRPSYRSHLIAINIFGYFYYMTYHIVINTKYQIRKCKNCCKYYIAEMNSKQLYCDNPYNENQTCKDIGNQIAQLKKQQEDLVYGKYRKIYAKKAMLVKRNPDITSYKDEYEEWKKEAQKLRNNLKDNKITNDEFEKWLDENN